MFKSDVDLRELVVVMAGLVPAISFRWALPS
jgi:hypothetical protein